MTCGVGGPLAAANRQFKRPDSARQISKSAVKRDGDATEGATNCNWLASINLFFDIREGMRAEGKKSLNRRELLRWGAVGAGATLFSSAAGCAGLPSMVYNAPPAPTGVAPVPAAPQALHAPGGINPQLFQRAKAALDQHRIWARDSIGIVDFERPSGDARFHVVDLRSGAVESYPVTHGKGSDPRHSGFLQEFSNTPGSEATSNGAYTTGEYYHGKYGLSMRLRGHDWTNNNAESRAIVIHNAWYAEPNVINAHGKLGRSQGCFAFSRKDQWEVMKRLAGGRLLYAEKIA
jgi:hypothetical protein